MNAGQELLDKLTYASLFQVLDENGDVVSPCIIVWSSGAAEQIDAMIHEILDEKSKP